MGMMPPSPGAPAGPPAGPTPGGAGPSPTPGSMPGVPPGAIPPGAGQGQPGKGGPSLSAALASPFADVSIHLPHHYQLLDVAASTVEQAINTGGFSTEPKNEAGVKSIYHQLSQLIANRTREGQLSASVTPEPERGTGADDQLDGEMVDDEGGPGDEMS